MPGMLDKPRPNDHPKQTQAGWRDRASSSLSQATPVFKVAGWVVAGVALVVLGRVAYLATEDGTYKRELVLVGLGSVITAFAAAGVAFLALFSEFQRMREQDTLKRFAGDSWQRQSVRVGRMEIPDVAVVRASNAGVQWTELADLVFEPFAEPRELAPEIKARRDAVIAEVSEEARRKGLPMFDGDAVDIVDAKVDLIRGADGRKRPQYTLTPAPAKYFDFLGTTANLDARVDGGPTLRELSREMVGFDPQGIDKLDQLPAMAKLGSGTAVVTSDERIVLGVRGKLMIAGALDADDARSVIHVVAEGVDPADVDRNALLNPRETALRGLEEELNIGNEIRHSARVTSLEDTGFFFDQLRWQPCFAFLARIDRSWEEFHPAAVAAQDAWEVERLISLPFDIHHEGVRRLLLGTHPDLVLASNHAAMYLWTALLHKHGFTTVRDQLSRR